jgi:hypothetical protein
MGMALRWSVVGLSYFLVYRVLCILGAFGFKNKYQSVAPAWILLSGVGTGYSFSCQHLIRLMNQDHGFT